VRKSVKDRVHVSSEYSTGMIRLTLAAMPPRTTVLAAKAVITTGVVLAAGAIAVLLSLLAGRLPPPGHGFTPALGYQQLYLADGPVLRAAAGSALYLALIALLSLGVAAAVRDSAGPETVDSLKPTTSSHHAPASTRLSDQAAKTLHGE
jgi:ABC-2 type transport system permease protein